MTVTLGFVGCGRMGQMAHIANYAEIARQGHVRLKAVTDLKRSQAEAVASRYGIEKVYDSVDDICADDEIDGVVCIMFWALQVEPAIRLLEAGKHVIVEKPLAGSAAAGQRMVDAADAAGRHLVCGYMKCHDSGLQWARERVGERGATPHQAHLFFAGGDWWANLGEPITTDEPMPEGWGTQNWMPPGLSETQARAFTFFINIYSHHLGMLRYLLGRELELISIEPHGPSETVLFHAGGTQVVLMRSQMDCHWWEERLRLVFPDGYLDVLPPPPMARNVAAQVEDYVHGDGQTGTIQRPVTGWNWAFHRQAEHFVDVCAGRVEPIVPAEHGRRDLELMEQMAKRSPATS
jgi:predicted dehydrogenase